MARVSLGQVEVPDQVVLEVSWAPWAPQELQAPLVLSAQLAPKGPKDLKDQPA